MTCILFVDFVRFDIAQPHLAFVTSIDQGYVFHFFHSKSQHKQGLCTVNISQHCTFVSGVSQTSAWVRYYLTIIIFVKGIRSPEKNKVTWSVPGCQERRWMGAG